MVDKNLTLLMPDELKAKVSSQHQYSLKMVAQLYSAKTSLFFGKVSKSQDISLYEERSRPNELKISTICEF